MTRELHIGLTAESRQYTISILEQLLADAHVLYIKTRNFHWNVKVPRFHDLHKFFESQYDELEGYIDEIAERIRALGGTATGSMAGFLMNARIVESAGPPPSADSMLEQLLVDHETIIRHLRSDLATVNEKYGDAGTSDFLTGLMEGHEKMAWMLRAHLEKAE